MERSGKIKAGFWVDGVMIYPPIPEPEKKRGRKPSYLIKGPLKPPPYVLAMFKKTK